MNQPELIAALNALYPYQYVFDWQDGVEARGTYCRVTLLSQTDVGQVETPLTLASGENMVTQQSETASVRLQFFGDILSTAHNDAKKAKALLGTHRGTAEFYQRGMSILTVGSINRVGVERDTKWYVSNAIDMTLCYKSTIETDDVTIDSVSIESLLPPTPRTIEVEWT